VTQKVEVSKNFLLKIQEVINLGGAPFLGNQSLPQFIESVYSDQEWLPWKYPRTPQLFWESIENQKKFMDWVGKQKGFTSNEDWYKITQEVRIFKEYTYKKGYL
jgi:hypothetical protein